MNAHVTLAGIDRFIPVADFLGDKCVNIITFRNLQNDIEPAGLGDFDDPLAVIDQTVVLCIEPRGFPAAQLTLYSEHLPGDDTVGRVEAKRLGDLLGGEPRHFLNEFGAIANIIAGIHGRRVLIQANIYGRISRQAHDTVLAQGIVNNQRLQTHFIGY